MIATESVKFLINGEWEEVRDRTLHPITNPATGQEIAQVPYATSADVDRTARAAHAAFLKWREVPVVERVQVFYRYKDLLEKHTNEIARTLSTENGKTLEDALGSVRRGIQMVEVACGMPSLMMGQSLENVSKGIDCHSIRQPLGVCAGITPFNFPAMVPMWMFPFAIACGNTFILKPSEKVPLTPTRTAELLDQAGLPAGVCTARANRSTPCLPIRWCAPSPSSAPLPWRSTSTRPPPPTASASKPSAAPRTTWSRCPTPPSTKVSKPS